MKRLFNLLFALLLSLPLVLAETDSYSAPPLGGILLIIIIWIVHGMEKKSKKKTGGKPLGIDGWLLFFIILFFASSIFGFLGYVISFIVQIMHGTFLLGYSIFDFLFILFDFVLFGFGIYIGINLWKVNKKSINWAKIWIVVSLASELIYSWFVSSQPQLYDASFSYFSLFATIVFTAIWLPYLFISKRVKNTYFRGIKPLPKTKRSHIVELAFFIIIANLPMLLVGYFIADEAQQPPNLEDLKFQADDMCLEECNKIPEATSYVTELNETDYSFSCYCFDDNDEYLEGWEYSFD